MRDAHQCLVTVRYWWETLFRKGGLNLEEYPEDRFYVICVQNVYVRNILPDLTYTPRSAIPNRRTSHSESELVSKCGKGVIWYNYCTMIHGIY